MGPGWRRYHALAGLLAALALASAAGEARPVQGAPGEAAPAWVKSFPHDPRLYIGIGRSDKRSHPANYREMAQAAALAQISREISIRLKSENTSSRSEDGMGRDETWVQKISASSRNELTGYVLADVHETDIGYWVLYTLDKEIFQRALDERESRFGTWLEEEASALDSELEARQLPKAMDRYARIRGRYDSAYAGDPLIHNRSAGISARFRALGEKIRSAARGLKLVSGESEWILDYRELRASENPRTVDLFLVDGKTGEKWMGPLSVSLSNRRSPASASCRVETGEAGKFDLASAFLGCGLPSGAWRVTWMGRDGQAVHLDVKAALIPMDISVRISGTAAGMGNIRVRLEEELAAGNGPYYNFVSVKAALPSLDIQIREVALDSLEGMFFTSIRGTARYPGMPGPSEIQGKAGHADLHRSQARALRDFSRQVVALRGIRLSY